MHRLPKPIQILLLTAIYLGAWQLLSMLVNSSLLFPSPYETASSMVRIVQSAACWRSIGSTFLRLLLGFLLGCVLGVLLAVLTARWKTMSFLLSPLRTIVKTTPITSFILVLFFAVVSNAVPVVVSMIMVVPLVWQATEQAILAMDPKLDEMATIYYPALRKLFLVQMPQVLPAFGAAASTALGFAWKAVITAEILAFPQFGIGNEMYNCKVYLDTPDLFAWTILVILCSLLMEFGLKKLLGKRGRAG